MTKKELTELIRTGREIELFLDGKNYSVTYYNDNRKNYISFCEFYKQTVDVSTADDLWNSTYNGENISTIFLSTKDEDITIF